VGENHRTPNLQKFLACIMLLFHLWKDNNDGMEFMHGKRHLNSLPARLHVHLEAKASLSRLGLKSFWCRWSLDQSDPL